MGVNVGEVLHQTALRHPRRVALVEVSRQGRSEVTYEELDRGALRVAAELRAAGIPPGGRVALAAQNGRAFVTTWFGITYASCTVVPIPILSAAPEIALRLAHARCDAVVTDRDRRETAARGLERTSRAIRLFDAEGLGDARTPLARPEDASPDDPAMILYTSGTTGRPKGAAITHASLATHTAALVHHTLALGPDDRVLGALPLTHSYGIRMVVLVTFFAGGRAVLLPRFDAALAVSCVAEEGVTWLPVVPTMLSAVAGLGDEAPRPPFQALRWCLSAGAPLADDVRRRAEERLGTEVRQGYGLTEATFSTIDAPPAPRTPGSVGRPVWGVEVRVVGEDGRDVPAGAQGQVLVRGNNAMSGYVDDAAATREVVRDGWIATGDLGRLDAEGRLFVVDRLKDMILRGGHNVYPSEVEDVLAQHAAIADVAVVGRPDAHFGEEIVAVVVLHPGARLDRAELDAFARENLAKNKVPREIAVVAELPLGPSRKVLKRELRARIADGRLRPVPLSGG